MKSLFGECNVLKEYGNDDRYPYHCDVYIKNLDLFIELNLFFTHGKHPFNSNDLNDLKKLELWELKSKTSKFYKNAINVWTKLDIEKIECAKRNNLNYVCIYTNDELDNFIKEMTYKYEN